MNVSLKIHVLAAMLITFVIMKNRKEAQSKFFTVDLNVEKIHNAFSPNLNALHLTFFKILRFKVNNFPLAVVLSFCQV